MEQFLTSAKSFASMRENFDEQFFSQCAREYALSLVSMLIEKYGSACASDTALFSSMFESPTDADQMPFWCPELGHCLAALTGDKLPIAQRGLAQIALNLLSSGTPGTWVSDFAEPIHLRWGHVILPEALRLEVESDGAEARVKITGLDAAHNLRFSALKNGELEWQGSGAEATQYLKFGRNRVLLLSGQQCKDLALPDPVLPGVTAVTEAQIKTFTAAVALFHEHFPSWVSWLDRVLRVITLAQRPPEGIHSGTVEGYYGSIWISDSDDLLKIAESFLHEGSHQYFFLLNRLDALTNDDGRRFYSPFVQRERPPDKLLLAYHAFTNVEMFYQGCLRLGIKPSQCELVLAQVKKELGCVEEALSKEIDLTPVGRSFFDSLLTHRSSHGILN
jgi:HEXXH motif-containing protein